jgi:hypothetical protein
VAASPHRGLQAVPSGLFQEPWRGVHSIYGDPLRAASGIFASIVAKALMVKGSGRIGERQESDDRSD